MFPLSQNLRKITSHLLVYNRSLLINHENSSLIIYINSLNYSTKTKQKMKFPELQKSKEKLIEQMNFQSKKHASSFYDLSILTLIRISNVTKRDIKGSFCKNRIYYIADRLKCDPAELSKALSKRTFVFTLSPDWLENSLNVLLEMGVTSDRIMRDLWVLKYNHESIRQRLQRVKDMGQDNLYPWMVRCSETILNRSIKIAQDKKDILGDNNISTQEYLAKRLNATSIEVEEMCIKIPYLKYIRVTKAKSFLDFLIKEGFTEEEITQKPRVLASSQDTIAKRLVKLRSLGINNINLNILCRSQKDFTKYCNGLQTYLKTS